MASELTMGDLWQLLYKLRTDLQAAHQVQAEMRALLEAFTETDPSGYGAESSTRYCPYCDGLDGGSDNPEYDSVEHAPECPWVKARALLALHKV